MQAMMASYAHTAHAHTHTMTPFTL